MKPASLKLIFLGILTLVYNFFFWNEKLGLNLLLFSVLLIIGLMYFYQESLQATNTKIAIAFTLIAAVMVVLHNSLTSKLAHVTSFLIMVGFLHVRHFRTVYYPLADYCINFFEVLPNAGKGIQQWFAQSGFGSSQTAKSLLKLRFSFVPLVFFSVFFTIFKVANPIFSDLSNAFFNSIYTIFEQFFTTFSLPRLLFILGGLYLIGSFLYHWSSASLLTREQAQRDTIGRQRRFVKSNLIAFKPLALKNEYTAAIMLIISVNALLLIVNIIDIRWLWFNFDYQAIRDFSVLIHEGTYMLIMSILLSMGILLFYFRRSLNFYAQNKLLVQASYVWIFQNCILGVSVLLRCYYYFHEHGLAYKRIGVVVFLLLTYVGLYTLYLKISRKKSFFYLLRVNS